MTALESSRGRIIAQALTLTLVLCGFALSASAETIGDTIRLSYGHSWWPSVGYNATSDAYLVLYEDRSGQYKQLVGRIIDAENGQLQAPSFRITSTGILSSAIGQAAHNPNNGEWFIAHQGNLTYYEEPEDLFGARFASDGTKLQDNIHLVVTDGYQQFVDVACDTANSTYLVVWQDSRPTYPALPYPNIRGRLFQSDGSPAGAEIKISDNTFWNKTKPRVEYNPVSHEFMVVWCDMRNWDGVSQPDQNYADIYGQRIAATGTLVGTNIPIYTSQSVPYAPDGHDPPTDIVCNSASGEYFVGWTHGYTTVRRLIVSSTGDVVHSAVDVAAGACAGVGYTPEDDTYCVTYMHSAQYTSARQYSSQGVPLEEPEVIFFGDGVDVTDGALAVRARPGVREYLQIAYRHHPDYSVYAQRFAPVVPAVVDFQATAWDQAVELAWVNPADPHFTQTIIRYREDRYPTNRTDGTLVAVKPNSPGSSDACRHEGLTNGQTYFYAAFAVNDQGLWSRPTMAVATPWPTTRAQINGSSFTNGADGWTLGIWRSGSYEYGSMLWSSDVGNPGPGMRSAGAGGSDNDDRCTREGGWIRKTIPLSGYKNILVSYDLRTSGLGADHTGFGSGSCDVDHDLIDEQLTVCYSTDAGGNWVEADWLRRDELLPAYQTYCARQFDLSDIGAVNNNPGFALRFRWQFNNNSDRGDLDNIEVFGDLLSVADAKAVADAEPITLFGKALYYKQGAVGYIEEMDRASGIRIEGYIQPSPDELVRLSGTMGTTPSGERCIHLSSIVADGSASVLPLGATNRAAKCDLMDGLYVKIWGVVKPGSIADNSFEVTDGSDDTGIRVITPSTPQVTEGEFVLVTGAAGSNGARVVYLCE